MIFDSIDDANRSTLTIKVLGIGRAGINAVNAMKKTYIPGVKYHVLDTDIADLKVSMCQERTIIGKKKCRGQKAYFPKTGQEAAMESIKDIQKLVQNTRVIFLVVGLGGGAGGGIAPVVANIAKKEGALVVSLCTMPFDFESFQTKMNAQEALEHLKNESDTTTIIENQKLVHMLGAKTLLKDAFLAVDQVLVQSVLSIASIMTTTGTINIDIADITTVMKDKGTAFIGRGSAKGPDRAKEATRKAIQNPYINSTIENATYSIVTMSASSEISLMEMSMIFSTIHENNKRNINIIQGFSVDSTLGDELVVTIIATSNLLLS